jgi:hypothetical protein
MCLHQENYMGSTFLNAAHVHYECSLSAQSMQLITAAYLHHHEPYLEVQFLNAAHLQHLWLTPASVQTLSAYKYSGHEYAARSCRFIVTKCANTALIQGFA